ncbi:hypothetical protein IX299_001882 [Porphyromonas levii]|nr:hypothetical protein [Porphyromonas levii]
MKGYTTNKFTQVLSQNKNYWIGLCVTSCRKHNELSSGIYTERENGLQIKN